MKLESELNREYAIELSKLILDNPKMRVSELLLTGEAEIVDEG